MFKSLSASQVVISLALASASFVLVGVDDASAQKLVHEPLSGDAKARSEPVPPAATQPVVGEKPWSPQKTALPEPAEALPPAAPNDAAPAAAPADGKGRAAATPWNRPQGTQPPAEAADAQAPAAAPAKSAGAVVDRGRAETLEALAAARAAAEQADRANDEGISDDRDVVKPVLARHPDSNLVICVAGCGPEPQIVQVLPKAPETKSDSEVVPSSANGGDKTAGEASQGPTGGTIICIAGCKSGRGEVVFKRARISWINPNESDAVRQGLRQIADRLSGELRVIATAEQSRTLTTWAGMGRLAIASIARTSTVADATESADVPEPRR